MSALDEIIDGAPDDGYGTESYERNQEARAELQRLREAGSRRFSEVGEERIATLREWASSETSIDPNKRVAAELFAALDAATKRAEDAEARAASAEGLLREYGSAVRERAIALAREGQKT